MDSTDTALIGAAAVVVGAIAGSSVRPFLNWVRARRGISDRQALRAWRLAFERQAFRGRFAGERRDFDKLLKAVEETVRAFDTGIIPVKGGNERAKPVLRINNSEWRQTCQLARGSLDEIRNDLLAIIDGQIASDEATQRLEAIDGRRDRVVQLMNEVWHQVGEDQLPLPTETSNIPIDE
jgi:hypothetical protein